MYYQSSQNRWSQTTSWTVRKTVAAAALAVSVDEAKQHLNLSAEDNTHDNKLETYIEAAVEQLEKDANQALINQTFVMEMDEWPNACQFEFPRRPLSSVSSITYYDASNVQQTLATSVYGVDTGRREIFLKYNQEWPNITYQRNCIAVTAVCGYGATASTVPRLAKQAIMLMVGHWFYNPDMSTFRQHTWTTAYDDILKRLERASYP